MHRAPSSKRGNLFGQGPKIGQGDRGVSFAGKHVQIAAQACAGDRHELYVGPRNATQRLWQQRHPHAGRHQGEQGCWFVGFVDNPGLAYVWVLNPRAEPEEVLTGPAGASVTNLAFGGPERNTLFCTDSTHGTILKAEMTFSGSMLRTGLS